MRTLTRFSAISIPAVVLLSWPLAAAPNKVPLYQQFLSPASPQEVVAARKVDRVAWVDYAEGKRNAYTAAAPLFAPVRLTNFHERRRHHDVGGPDFGRRQHGRVSARRGAEPRGLVAQSVRRPERAGARDLGGAHQRRGRSVAGGRRHQSRTGAGWQRDSVRESGPDLSREANAGEAGQRSGSRREGVHHRVGRAERSEVVAGRPQDRVRQHAHRSQLHRGVRRRDAIGEVHVAERGFRHDADVAAGQQAPDLHAAAGPAVRTAGAAGRGRNRSAERTGVAATAATPARQATAAVGAAGEAAGATAAPAEPSQAAARRSGTGCAGRGQQFPGPDASDVQRRLHARVLQGRRHAPARRRRPGTTSPTMQLSPNLANAHLAGDLVIFQFAVGGGRGGRGGRGGARGQRRPAPAPESEARPATQRASGRMGSLLLAQRHGCVGASGAADDDRRADRKSDVGRGLGRREDLLLLHERQGYRAAPHLGGAGGRRHAGADHDGRGRRDLPGAARVRQVPGDAERQLEHAAIGGRVEAREAGRGSARRRSSSRRRGRAFRWKRT